MNTFNAFLFLNIKSGNFFVRYVGSNEECWVPGAYIIKSELFIAFKAFNEIDGL